jgi:DNA repair protein RecO (recombination protein O)
MPRVARARTERLRSDALLVRRVPFGEADLMISLFTEERGLVSAVARSARRSWKRFAALEPMHLLRVALEERPGVELMSLAETSIARPRSRLVADLGKLEAAGRALRWVRRASPPQTPEPGVWLEINALLDRLDLDGNEGEGADPARPALSPEAHLATTGLRILTTVGWGLDLDRCVRCGRPCAAAAAACIDPASGGLVCRACGGSSQVLRADRRARMLAALAGDDGALLAEDAAQVIDLVDAALSAHSGQG